LLLGFWVLALLPSVEAAVFPEKGRTITFIINQTAGGPTDLAFRVLAAAMEKDLGVPIAIVNKPGATGQVGTTELVRSKPDGYTIGNTNLPSTLNNYLEPDRKAVFGRKDLQQVANQVVDPECFIVRADSPFTTLQDLVAGAKARPERVTMGTSGLLGNNHLAAVHFQKAAGVKFRFVHFEGGAPATNALLGGHVDSVDLTAGTPSAHFKTGAVRYLGIMEREPSPLFPGVPTFASQGYNVFFASSRGISVRAGTPQDVVEILAGAVKRAMESPDVKKRMDEMGLVQRYMGPAEYTKYWDDLEAQTKPLLEELLKEQRK
jgi:tripartite-type tricarboxylate transporter receptor subunit TctC